MIFILPPEFAQKLSLFYLKIFSFLYKFPQETKEVKGLNVKNRLGLAAGLDKNGELIKEMDNIGFGFIEIGTVTPKPQYGNPKPRLKRLVNQESLLNSLGFNNDGAEKIQKRLEKLDRNCILGINIGPNKSTLADKFYEDYSICMKSLAEHADYMAINISSPNTPELRDMHKKENIEKIIKVVLEERDNTKNKPKILIKLSPDENDQTYLELIELINATNIDGVIISNTSNNQELKKELNVDNLPGGISGLAIKNKSNELLKFIKKNLKEEKILVAVGGVFDVDSYNEKIDMGADLVQMYTGLVFEGPNQVRRIVKNGR